MFGRDGRIGRSVASAQAERLRGYAFTLVLQLVRACDERDDLLPEHVGVAAGNRSGGLLLALAESAEEPPAAGLFLVGHRRNELRDGVRLDVPAAVQRPELFEQIVFVRRREERRDQDHVRDLRTEGCDSRVRRVHEQQIRVHVFADDPFEDRALAMIRLDGKYERHVG